MALLLSQNYQYKQEALSYPLNAKEYVTTEAGFGTNVSREQQCSAWYFFSPLKVGFVFVFFFLH